MSTQRVLVVAALVLSALVLGGCAGGPQTERSGTPRRTLPRALALQLAAEGDEIARKLADGDSCAARDAALRLREQTVRAIDGRLVPAVFRAKLESTADDLASRIRCVVQVPPVPSVEPSPPPEQQGHESHGKHKGRGKHEGKGAGD